MNVQTQAPVNRCGQDEFTLLSLRRFQSFSVAPNTTGESFKKLIVKKLQDACLSLSNLCGQGYDGVSNIPLILILY